MITLITNDNDCRWGSDVQAKWKHRWVAPMPSPRAPASLRAWHRSALQPRFPAKVTTTELFSYRIISSLSLSLSILSVLISSSLVQQFLPFIEDLKRLDPCSLRSHWCTSSTQTTHDNFCCSWPLSCWLFLDEASSAFLEASSVNQKGLLQCYFIQTSCSLAFLPTECAQRIICSSVYRKHSVTFDPMSWRPDLSWHGVLSRWSRPVWNLLCIGKLQSFCTSFHFPVFALLKPNIGPSRRILFWSHFFGCWIFTTSGDCIPLRHYRSWVLHFGFCSPCLSSKTNWNAISVWLRYA